MKQIGCDRIPFPHTVGEIWALKDVSNTKPIVLFNITFFQCVDYSSGDGWDVTGKETTETTETTETGKNQHEELNQTINMEKQMVT